MRNFKPAHKEPNQWFEPTVGNESSCENYNDSSKERLGCAYIGASWQFGNYDDGGDKACNTVATDW